MARVKRGVTAHKRHKRLLNDALDRADESPLPDPATLEHGVFASQEDLDTPHHK